ncbi:hypothetical protein WN944_006302 [Citrus x changshan-huyou]|uniref:Uncharacterized protein n=1 Tax=Citrus x changshan-huyou TaxID=2935761 RepID=A0AAP0ML35_9ROSI
MLWIIFEGLLPLGIILAILTITGNVQYHIHKAVHGRLKHVGNDMRDMADRFSEEPAIAVANDLGWEEEGRAKSGHHELSLRVGTELTIACDRYKLRRNALEPLRGVGHTPSRLSDQNDWALDWALAIDQRYARPLHYAYNVNMPQTCFPRIFLKRLSRHTHENKNIPDMTARNARWHDDRAANNWRSLWGSRKKPPHGAKLVNKGKSVKQSTGIQPDEEPVTHKHFEDLAHAILRAVGSRVPEADTSPVTQDVPPPCGEKQIIPRSEISEGSRPKHGPSGTRSKFQTGDSREEHSTASCYSRSSQGTKRKQKVHEDLRHKLNAKRASQTTAASSGVPGVPREFLKKNGVPRSSSEVPFLKQNPTNTLAPTTYNSPFTMEIQIAVLPEAFTMPQIKQYSSTSDPLEHAELYHDQILIKGVGDNAMCMIFPHTLTGPAKSWFRSLKACSVS